MNRIGSTVAIALGAAAATLAGCASHTPAFDANFGASLRVLQAQQTANPNAPTENAQKSPDGMEGETAQAAYDRYQRTFRAPEPQPNVFTIGVGGGGK
ncbi:MAG: hypothetical protein JSW68_04975 [Burkholderiales bacterium]|nr:MAG: hypothetical protein JSW68_04975 [Burkholderiales bacterium]